MSGDLHYVWRLTRSVFTVSSAGRFRAHGIAPALVVVSIVVAGAMRTPADALARRFGSEKSEMDGLLERTRALNRSLQEVQQVYALDIEPIERVLLHYRNEPRPVRRIAAALVREARRTELAPEILMAVLLVENPWLEPTAKSQVGATGLMQVMPGHRGRWSACGESLENIEGNICYGAHIFAENVRLTRGDIEKALLRYNGCVSGTTTPNCKAYPERVFARAGRAVFLTWNSPSMP